MTKFCMDLFSQAQASCPEPAGQREGPQNREDHFDTAGTTGINRTPFAASFLRNRISFCWHLHKRRNQAIKDPLPWVEFKAFLERVWVTQELLYIPSGVALDKTLSTSGKKWSIGRPTSSISIEFDADKSEKPNLIRFFQEERQPLVKAQMEQRKRELDS